MLEKIKRLGIDTAIYGISTIFGRFLSFMLLPLYVNVLSTGEYGIVANVYSYIAFLNVLYGCGMEAAYFKFASSKEFGDEKSIFHSAWMLIVAVSGGFSALIIAGLHPVTGFVARSGDELVILYSAGILFCDSLTLIPFAALRLQKKPMQFASIRLASIVLNLVLNLVLLIKFRMGIQGVFLSGLLSSCFAASCFVPLILKRIGFRIDAQTVRRLIMFGIPTVPAGIAGIALQIVDRPILRALTNDSAVGIYSANYRMGIFMMLVVSMFDYAWRPFFLANAKEKDAPQLFARITTYFFMLMMTMFLLVSLFIDQIVKIRLLGHYLLHPAYWSGIGIVPVILLAYVFTGLYVLFLPGIYIKGKTYLLPLSTGLGAAVNIIMNYLVIPVYGIAGAAWASFVGYGVMAISLFIVTQRIYPVRYEYRRLAILAGVSAGCYALYWHLKTTGLPLIPLKAGTLACFIGLLGATKFFEPSEIRAALAILRRKSSASNSL